MRSPKAKVENSTPTAENLEFYSIVHRASSFLLISVAFRAPYRSINRSLRQLHKALVRPQTRIHGGHLLKLPFAVLPRVRLDVALHRLFVVFVCCSCVGAGC